jgi:hypothetical protein
VGAATHSHSATGTLLASPVRGLIACKCVQGNECVFDSVVICSLCVDVQVNGLQARLDGWVDKVSSAAMTLENEAVGIAQIS